MNDLYAIFAVAYATVTLVAMGIAEPIRRITSRYTSVLECEFCTSFWVSLVVASYVSLENLPLRVLGIAGAANVVILLINLSLTLFEEPKDEG